MFLLLLALPAQASFVYPDTVEAELAMPCAPSCMLCHESLAGGSGTVTKPTGQALMGEGLTGGSNTDALVAALEALAANGTDSDADGTADVDELAAGADPNGGADFCGADAVEPPVYGCVDVGGAGTSAAGIVGVVLAAAGAARRRRA